jgi:hypothetical protein
MSAVLIGLFEDYAVAAHVRITLVRDGFPTDRVELTHASEMGRAGLEPASSRHDCFLKYLSTLLGLKDGPVHAEPLAQRLEAGAAAITVHPRGLTETTRALEILQGAGCAELVQHDLANQWLEHAAAAREQTAWIRNLWIETTPGTDCIYCRLFPPKGEPVTPHDPSAHG